MTATGGTGRVLEHPSMAVMRAASWLSLVGESSDAVGVSLLVLLMNSDQDVLEVS